MLRGLVLAGVLTMTVLGASCGRSGPDAGKEAGGPRSAPPVVGVIAAKGEPVPMTVELPGRVEAFRVAQVRARVPGIVQKRLFEEGSDVKVAQPLFQIDPSALQAQLVNANAAVVKAEAALNSARAREKRFAPLVDSKAISQQEFADLVSARQAAEADLVAARAARENARLSLSYALVRAPIAGRIGRALVTEGALVGQGEATPLAVIQQLDPIYVNVMQSSADYLALRDALAEGDLSAPERTSVTLLGSEGESIGDGRLLFTDVTVDTNTGNVTIRAQFPNPERTLLPGMFVRARLAQAIDKNAYLLPKQAALRSDDGDTVLVIEGGQAVPRKVTIAGARGRDWIVTSGLTDGDQVIVEGLQKAQPGAPVEAQPWQPPAEKGADEKGSAEKAPAQKAPAEKAPAQKAPVENAPAEKK